MARLVFISLFFFLVLFWFRVHQIGGLHDEQIGSVDTFKSQRDYLVKILDDIFSAPQSNLIAGILIGNQSSLPYHLKQSLQSTSTIHMVVVSGQNLAILAGFLTSLAPIFGKRKTLVFSFIAVVLYSFLTGLQVPTIRALIMASFACGAQILGREKVGWWVLLLTASLMLLYNPNYLLNISFQLSFLATLAVVSLAPLVINLFRRLPSLVSGDLSVTFSAQLLTLPVIAYNFHQISVVGLLANLLVGWTIPIIMIFGFASLLAGVLSLTLAKVVAIIPMILLTYYIDTVELLAKLPYSWVKVGDSSLIFWLGFYLLIAAVFWGLSIKQKSNQHSGRRE